jgi:hypothetical protein
MAAKQYALMQGLTYKYKIRLRPDVGLTKPIPLPNQINFQGDNSCSKVIYHSNPSLLAVGAEDTFNIGEAEDMDHLLDRYVDLTTKPFIYRSWRNYHYWNSESYLLALLEERYHICLRHHDDIWMLVLRKPDHPKVTYDKDPLQGDNLWTKLNAESLS